MTVSCDRKSNDDALVEMVEELRGADALRPPAMLLEFVKGINGMSGRCVELALFNMDGAMDELAD